MGMPIWFARPLRSFCDPAARPEPMSIENFKIAVPDPVLADLSGRLDATRWPDQMDNGGWAAGTNLAYMKSIAGYWRDGYDWKRQERALNALPNYRIALDGLG